MARAGTVITRVAELAGYPPAAIDRMLRSLRVAGLVPKGPRGLGQVEGAYQSVDLANLLLSFAGPQTSDAAEAVKLLRPLVRAPNDGGPLGPETLGGDVEAWIEGFAMGLAKPGMGEAKELPLGVELSLMRLSAVVTYIDHQDFYMVDLRQPSLVGNIRSRLRRGVSVEKRTFLFTDLIVECGRLYFDTLQHLERLETGASLLSNGFQNETAASLAGEAAANTGTPNDAPALSTPSKDTDHGTYSTAPARGENPQRILLRS